MQSVRSRIWTRVAVSISCDDNHYTTDTSIISDDTDWDWFMHINSCNYFEDQVQNWIVDYYALKCKLKEYSTINTWIFLWNINFLLSQRKIFFFLFKHYTVKIDITKYYLLPNSTALKHYRDLQSALLRYGTWPNEWGTQWDLNSLV